MKRYLSVDLDFWNDQHPDDVENDLTRLFSLARKKGIPIVAVMNHQQLLRYVDESKARELVNLDTHSDLSAVDDTEEFNCGTWVSFVRWRHRGTYRWLHQKSVGAGECSWQRPIFMSTDCSSVQTRPEETDWKKVTHRKVKGLPNTSDLLKDCVDIGFVLSPAYTDVDLEEVFRTIVKKFDIPYKKGRRNEEYYGAWRKPPYRRSNKQRRSNEHRS